MNASKIPVLLNNDFSRESGVRFQEMFGLELVTTYNVVIMQLVSVRADGKPFTRKQHAWLDGFSTGYASAMNLVSAYSAR